MNPHLIFCDVFTLDEKDYIFLGKTLNIMYAARILDIETSREVERIFLRNVSRNKTTNTTLFCFVKLKTSNYKGKIASLTQPTMSIDRRCKKLNIKISEEDKNNLIDEILNSRGVPLALKELFSS